jgi:NAD(P)-dependent dehydrogenase (short-subunit alcohol dehydrogenase family)
LRRQDERTPCAPDGATGANLSDLRRRLALGAATARMLAGEGADVVVADLKCQAAGENTRFVETDVTDEVSRRALSTPRCRSPAACTGP